MHSLVHELNGVHDHATFHHFLAKMGKFVEFSLVIKIGHMELVFSLSDESVIFFLESVPVNEVSHSESESQDFGCVAWANTLQSGSDGILTLSLLSHCIGRSVDV